MTNKINGLNSVSATVTSGDAPRRSKDAAAGSGSDTAQTANVEITQRARALASLEAALAQAPVVDEQRVAAIRSEISDGRYSVDSAKVAEQILRFDADLATARKADD